MNSPAGRRDALAALICRGLSQRKACRYLILSRRIPGYRLRRPEKDQHVKTQLLSASQEVPRFGYRRLAAWLTLGESCVRRLWRELGLQIPRRRPRRRRSGSDIRMPGAVKPNAVWSYDFVHDQLVDGRALRMLCAIDEYTRECLTIEVAARLRSQDVILTLSRLMRLYGKPAYIRSDNGAEFTAAKVAAVLKQLRGSAGLLAAMIYGSGLRRIEAVQLRGSSTHVLKRGAQRRAIAAVFGVRDHAHVVS